MEDPDLAALDVLAAAEEIHQVSVAVALESHRQRIDGEVTAVEILADQGRDHLGQRGRRAVELGAGGGDIDLEAMGQGHHRGQKGRVRMMSAVELLREVGREGDAVAFDHQIDVLVGPLQEQVPHHAADQVHRHLLAVCDPARTVEHPLHPRRRELAEQASDRLAYGPGPRHPVVESRTRGVLVFEEPPEQLHPGDDARRLAAVFHHHETVGPLEEEIAEIFQWRRGRHGG